MKRRVVVTGIGVVSSIGTTTDEFWRNCLAGKSIVEEIPPRWKNYTDFKSTIWSPLPSIDYEKRGINRAQLMQHDPVSLNAILAATEAMSNCGKFGNSSAGHAGPVAGDTLAGIFLGTGIGGASTLMENHLYSVSARAKKRLDAVLETNDLTEDQQKDLASVANDMHHPRRINPFMVSMVMANSVAASLGIHFSIQGPNRTYSQACASGTVAIGEAFRAVRDGDVNAALAGGSEYFYDYHGHLFRAFDVSGALVQNCDPPAIANRPFDKKRSGFLFGQGASAILMLETLEAANARQAPVLAEVTGYAESFDAHSMMAIEPGGRQIEQVIRSAIQDAGLKANDIDYVNAHGTGTVTNDNIESEVLRRVFGKRPLINSTKSLVGHTIGASGALEAAVLALSLYNQNTHGNKNLSDPITDLNFATGAGEYSLSCGLSQSFAFGGHNAAVVMERFGND